MTSENIENLAAGPGAGIPEVEVHQHGQHDAVINRLSRIEGHVRAIKRMVEENRACPDVLVQVAAVRAALNSVGRVILEDHIESCLVDAVERDDFDRSLRDLKLALDKFMD